MVRIENLEVFKGQHCETTTTGTLLKQIGISLSEPMLFGLGEGLGFIFWNMKMMDFPFIGGRVKPDVLTENICRNLNLELKIEETSSIKKAWENVSKHINQGKIAGVKLDCYHLDYFSSKIHFAGHYVAMHGYDSEFVYLVDTDQQGGSVKTSLENFALARNERGPMSSRNLTYTINQTAVPYNLKEAIITAIKNNALEYLNPPIKNISYKGILKTSTEIKKWFKNSANVKTDFQTTAMLMERAGTGGALFRNLYRDFLKESYMLLNNELLHEAYQDFIAIAKSWTEVSELFYKSGESEDVIYINQASEILENLSEQEKTTMEKLMAIKG